jgi:hypothetical protein
MRPCTGVCRLCAAGMCSPSRCSTVLKTNFNSVFLTYLHTTYVSFIHIMPYIPSSGAGGCIPCIPSLVQQRDSSSRGVRSSVVEGDNFCGMNRTGGIVYHTLLSLLHTYKSHTYHIHICTLTHMHNHTHTHTGLSIITEHLSNTELVFVSFKNDTTHKVLCMY